MGAVRIYKESNASSLNINSWQVRSHDCKVKDSNRCGYGSFHGGYCDGYHTFEYLVESLNNPNSELGAYLKK